MKRNSWIFVSLSIIQLCYAANKLPPDPHQLRSPRAVSALQSFVSKVDGLVQLANGIIVQGQLLEKPDHVLGVVADLLLVNPKGLSDVAKLNLDSILETVNDLQANALRYKPQLNIAVTENALNAFNLFAKHLTFQNIEDSVNSVTAFQSAIIGMSWSPPNFNILDVPDVFLDLIDCFNLDHENKNFKKCYATLKSFERDTQVVEGKLDKVLEYKTQLKSSLTFLQETEALEHALLVVEKFADMMKHAGILQSISQSIDTLGNELMQYEHVRKTLKETNGNELKKLLRVELEPDDIPLRFTSGLPRGTVDLETLFNNTKTGGMLQKLIARGSSERMEKLRAVLAPLERFGQAMSGIEDSFGNWKNFNKSELLNVGNVLPFLNSTEEWKALNYSEVDSMKQCLVSSVSTLKLPDLTLFHELSNLSSQLSAAIRSDFEILEDLAVMAKNKKKFNELRLMMKEDGVMKGGPAYFLELLKKFSKRILADPEMTWFLQESKRQLEAYQTLTVKNFSKRLASFPNVEFIGQWFTNVTNSTVSSITACFSDTGFKKTQKALSGAAAFSRLTSSSLSDAKTALEGLRKVQKLLKDANSNWKSLGAEAPRQRRDQRQALAEYQKVRRLDNQCLPGLLQGSRIVTNINEAHKNIGVLVKSLKFQGSYDHDFSQEWRESGERMAETTINELHALEVLVASGKVNFAKIREVYKAVSKMKGVKMNWHKLDNFLIFLNSTKVQNTGVEVFPQMKNLNLDFAVAEDEWHLIFLSLNTMKAFLDEIFQDEPETITPAASFWAADASTSAFMLLAVLAGIIFVGLLLTAIICSCTPSGRSWWKRFYVSRYGSPEAIALYWRYSFFLDQESDKNTLCEAVREVNYEQVKVSVRKGAYVNVYNCSGNTPLHAAVMNGHLPTVKLLLRNGADRKALNAENKTAEGWLTELLQAPARMPSESSSRRAAGSEKIGSFQEIARLFQKYKNKTFRPRLPALLPTMAYRIRVDDRVTHRSTDQFIEEFRGNVTDQKSGVTHFIVSTGKTGVFKSDDFGYIMCVFLPTILMQEQWMSECLAKKSNFRNDFKFRVEKVKYKGVVYDTVRKWASWVHTQKLPYLYGVRFHVAFAEFAEGDALQLRLLVEMHGAVWCDEMPVKKEYNLGSHPFHHQNLGPLFVIHDGKTNLDHLKNDSDKMYTLMTFDEFIVFMLEMKVTYGAEVKPLVPVSLVSVASSFGESTSSII